MTYYEKWQAHFLDLATLYAHWHKRFHSGQRGKSMREIHSICMFALCLENQTETSYLIGFQNAEQGAIEIDRIFQDDFGEYQDVDFILAPEPKKESKGSTIHHRCQLKSFIHQTSTDEKTWCNFLKKSLRVADDQDLRLVIHIEQEGRFNYLFLHAYLNCEHTRCPYSQVFAFGKHKPDTWFCYQVYPDIAIMPELTDPTAETLMKDRLYGEKLQQMLKS